MNKDKNLFGFTHTYVEGKSLNALICLTFSKTIHIFYIKQMCVDKSCQILKCVHSFVAAMISFLDQLFWQIEQQQFQSIRAWSPIEGRHIYCKLIQPCGAQILSQPTELFTCSKFHSGLLTAGRGLCLMRRGLAQWDLTKLI